MTLLTDRQREWRQVEGIEVKLVTGEVAKIQPPEGKGRAWVIQRITFGALVPAVLFGGRKVDIQTEAIAWVGRR